MPYGTPYSSSIIYRCIQCKAILSVTQGYQPYCCQCGTAQPDKDQLKELGLVIYGETYGKEWSSDLRGINEFLSLHQGKPAALWNYYISHSELELRLRQSDDRGKNDPPTLNTLFHCSDTKVIQLPQLRWNSFLSVQQTEDQYGPLCEVTDAVNQSKIV